MEQPKNLVKRISRAEFFGYYQNINIMFIFDLFSHDIHAGGKNHQSQK